MAGPRSVDDYVQMYDDLRKQGLDDDEAAQLVDDQIVEDQRAAKAARKAKEEARIRQLEERVATLEAAVLRLTGTVGSRHVPAAQKTVRTLG